MTIYHEIAGERSRQCDKGYDAAHDDRYHSVKDFVAFIKNYAGWALQMASMNSPDKARRRLIQVAALAVAAVELIDRKQAKR